jgi:hypothetical protein
MKEVNIEGVKVKEAFVFFPNRLSKRLNMKVKMKEVNIESEVERRVYTGCESMQICAR